MSFIPDEEIGVRSPTNARASIVGKDSFVADVNQSAPIQTYDEKRKDYWSKNVSSLNTASAEYDKNFKKTISDTVSSIGTTAKDVYNGKINPLTGGLETGKDILNFATKGIGDTLKFGYDALIKPVGEKISQDIETKVPGFSEAVGDNVKSFIDSPMVRDIAYLAKEGGQQWEIFKEEHPDVARSAEAVTSIIVNLAGIGGGKQVSKEVINEIENQVTQIQKVLPEAIESAKSTIDNFVENRTLAAENKTSEKNLIKAKEALNPTDYYTPNEKAQAYQQGNVKTKGKGIFQKEVIERPNDEAAQIVAEMARDGKITKTPSKNIESIKREARIADQEIDEVVNRPEFNKPYNSNIINKVYDDVFNSAKKDLVFVADTTEQKAYQAVVDVAKEEIAGLPKNMSGLRRGIKAFNARMERILGSDIYSGTAESVSNARLQAAKDVRKALNDFLADNLETPTIKPDKTLAGQKVVNTLPAKSTYETGRAQAGNIYKDKLRRQAILLNASDDLAYRASKNLDKRKLKLFLDKHPIVKKGLQFGSAGLIGSAVLNEFGL